MSTEPQRIYPKGQIAMDNGDLIDVTDFKIDTTNSGKQIHTLRRPGSGVFVGPEESKISFNSVVSEDGPERNYLQFVKQGTIKQIRLKIPGETITINGIHTARGVESSVDNEIKMSLEFIGHVDD